MAASGSYLGVQTGDLLLLKFRCVTEIMPVVGVSFGIPQEFSWIELGVTDANAEGTTWYNASLSLKANIQLQDIYTIVLIALITNITNHQMREHLPLRAADT